MFGLKKLYGWTLTLANKPWALWALMLAAFAESIFFPIPPDILLIPLVLGSLSAATGRVRWWIFPLAATFASAFGGLVGYGIGALLMDNIGSPILTFFHYGDQFSNLQNIYNEQGLIIVLIAGLTPIPYKLFTILSGAVGISLPVFIVGSLLARGGRFFGVALLLRIFGKPIKVFVDTHFNLLTIAIAVVFVTAIVSLRGI